jgi:hypothetical protein
LSYRSQSSSIDLTKLIHEKVLFPWVFKYNNLLIRDDSFDCFPSINFQLNCYIQRVSTKFAT